MDIHIIATNNTRGMLFSENNLLRAASYIRKVRRNSPHLLVLNNANTFCGSEDADFIAAQKEYARSPVMRVMNQIGYDASGISIQDLDKGLSYFNKAQAMAEFPFLCANILHPYTKETFFNTPYIIRQMGAMKIGILGMTATSEFRQRFSEEFYMEKTVDAARRWIRHMRDKENPDFVIVMYYGDIERMSSHEKMLRATEGVDLMLSASKLNEVIDSTWHVGLADDISELCHMQLQFKQRTTTFELTDYRAELVSLKAFKEDAWLMDELYYTHQEWQKKNSTR
ncbi:bifunctional metallophosphatase/5'-nucleotidase [Macrococcus hajekii]|uniref:Bifunctional metallophosphatase/5'-nucleotidase n=1 Tax=Macrococcus hajekii TaxID=198482 RepID=A0A4R6BNF5_9STAP|nr:bifunctional metallophosphatase/5'-nucleotidase [Macrococcus hajekii]TDM03394.1 bifunctional metallophosphatase/5'-nucleotidase [Macrococcus hajekii]GGA98487.1 hypothetical protein GCM10007190_03130 [Macrococcus hajekii]